MVRKISSLVASACLSLSAPAFADCPNSIIGTDGNGSTYRWTGTCYKFPNGCSACGPVHTETVQNMSRLPAGATCTRATIEAARVDGCSGGITRDRNRFKAACNEHDACYSTPGYSKATCDRNFLANLNGMCKFSDPSCYVSTGAFFVAVMAGAQSGYDGDQAWARQACTRR